MHWGVARSRTLFVTETDLDAETQIVSSGPRPRRNARKEHGVLLDGLGSFGESLHRNRIGHTHIKTLAAAVTEQRQSLAVRDEHVPLEAAEALSASKFKTIVQRWTSLCDDELSDPTRPEQHSGRRRVTLTVLPVGHGNLMGSWSHSPVKPSPRRLPR